MLKALFGSITTDNLKEYQIHLICNGIVIEDDRVISSYCITNGTIMHLVPRLRGKTGYIELIPYLMTVTSSDEYSDEDSDEDSN